jgi:DNA-binding MarR family transcriptional regulator
MGPTVARRQRAVKSDSDSATRTPAGDAFSELVVQVFRLNGLLAAAGDALAEPAGQTTARWRVLAAIEDAPLTVSQIARLWGLARQSVQRVADMLAQDGLAAYEENPGHRRAQLLRLTPRGRSALRTIQAAQRAWADTVGAQIGEADLRKAIGALGRVMRSLATRSPRNDVHAGERDPER